MNEIPNGTYVIDELFRKRERFAHQTTTPLAQCVVEPLDMARLTTFLAHGTMTLGGHNCGVGLPKIGVTDRTLAIHAWK
jgi:hypothetical protein